MPIQKACLIIILSMLLSACVKSASEMASDTALYQTEVVYQQIKKECPMADIEEPIKVLKTAIKTQLSSCEAEKQSLREKNNTLLAILIGVIVVFGILKIKKGLFK